MHFEMKKLLDAVKLFIDSVQVDENDDNRQFQPSNISPSDESLSHKMHVQISQKPAPLRYQGYQR